MGLKEKQALANLDFGWSERRVLESCGKKIHFEVQVESVQNDIDAIWMMDNQGAVYMANVIARICEEPVGKEAFNDKKISRILFINHPAAGSKKIVLNDGTIELHGSWGTSSDYLRENEIREHLENML